MLLASAAQPFASLVRPASHWENSSRACEDYPVLLFWRKGIGMNQQNIPTSEVVFKPAD